MSVTYYAGLDIGGTKCACILGSDEDGVLTILRREAYPNPYEALKALTRTNQKMTEETIHEFIQGLNVSDDIKNELMEITPSNYTGI